MADIQTAISRLAAADAEGNLTAAAVENIRTWLTEPYLEEYAPQVAEYVVARRWKELNEAFLTDVPFGGGGRQGKMYPIGCSAINDRTIGETAQGLADYIREQVKDKPLGCALAYDTRHRSRHFAELCAQIMAAAGFTVYFLDGYRGAAELSFAVRHFGCACGMMITACYQPPGHNGVKVYWSGGGQLLAPHDVQASQRMRQVTWIRRMAFAQGLEEGKIICCQEEVDAALLASVAAQGHPGPRDLKIIYSPLHGVGSATVPPVLEAAGFKDVEVFAAHASADPEFPNLPGHLPDPASAAVFEALIEPANEAGADLILATDSDCCRLGCACRATAGSDAPWNVLTGSQIGALLAEYLLAARQASGSLTSDHYVVKTLLTGELVRRVADGYAVRTVGNLPCGFNWIGGAIEEHGPERFVFAADESHGFLAGEYAREKDAAAAAMLLAELAAGLKAGGLTLCEQLDGLFRRHGCHTERTISLAPGGQQDANDPHVLLARFRSDPPQTVGGAKVARVRDYLGGTLIEIGGPHKPLDAPASELIFLDLENEGECVAVCPSDTPGQLKFCLFAYDPPQAIVDLQSVKAAQADRLAAMEQDLRALAGA